MVLSNNEIWKGNTEMDLNMIMRMWTNGYQGLFLWG